MTYTILSVDDEVEILEVMRLYLCKEGYKVITAENGIDALHLFQTHQIDLVILDIMMPELDGVKVLKRIRESSSVPIIMLSAKSEDYDKILGITLGADDYITKPFNPLEMVVRVQAQLRRAYNYQGSNKKLEILVNRQLKVYLDEGVVTLKDEPIDMTATEYKILKLLMSQQGRVFTKQQIFESIWESTFVLDDNTIMVHISNIRNKIEEDPKRPIYLKTIKGLGYKIEKDKQK